MTAEKYIFTNSLYLLDKRYKLLNKCSQVDKYYPAAAERDEADPSVLPHHQEVKMPASNLFGNKIPNEAHFFWSISTGCIQLNLCQAFTSFLELLKDGVQLWSTENSPVALRYDHHQQKVFVLTWKQASITS